MGWTVAVSIGSFGLGVINATYVAITTGPLVVNGQQTTWAGTIHVILGFLFVGIFLSGFGVYALRASGRIYVKELATIRTAWKRAVREASARETENLPDQEAPEHEHGAQSEWLER